MQISARNVLSGVVKDLKLGDVEAEVSIQVEGGSTLTATITRASAERLGLRVGGPASAVIKASDVMILVEGDQ